MKRMILAIPLLLASLAGANTPAAGMTGNPQREEAVVEFTELVKLQGVLLRGQYLIFHDDAKMEAGEPCLYIYTMKAGKRDQLVIALIASMWNARRRSNSLFFSIRETQPT